MKNNGPEAYFPLRLRLNTAEKRCKLLFEVIS